MKTSALVTLLALLLVTTLGARAQLVLQSSSPLTYVLNLSATAYGDPAYSLPTAPFTLPAGVWEFSFTNPGLTSNATYTAWSPFASAPSWLTAVVILPTVDRIGSTTTYPDAGTAFNAVSGFSTQITLTGATDFIAYFQDNSLGDNRGGVSLLLTQVSSVPEPTTTAAWLGGAIALAIGWRRRRAQPLALANATDHA